MLNMILVQIEKRVKALETKVRRLAQKAPLADRARYRTYAGRFADDPIFDEIAELGRAYRNTQRRRSRRKRP